MRIGIVTLWYGGNYGGALQAYALQTYLARLGHESVILPAPYDRRRAPLRKAFERPVRFVMEAVRERQFSAFRATHFHMSGQEPVGVDAFLRDPPRCDAYVVGSDQVWNAGACADDALRRLFFLDFGEPAARRVAYAASWGARALDPAVKAGVRACLARFTAISVREESGAALVADLGMRAAWLPDPTLLLEPEEWAELAANGRRAAGDGALFQCEYRWTPCVRFSEIRRVLMRRYGWRPVIPFSSHPLRDVLANRCLTPPQWVDGIRRSACVLTNSFHGMVFSVIFRRPFIVVPLAGRYAGMNERIFSLAGRLGLRDRILEEMSAPRVLDLAERPIAWDDVARRLQAWRDDARAFLTSALG